jgi:flagellar biogenesis protein FliO
MKLDGMAGLLGIVVAIAIVVAGIWVAKKLNIS